MLQRLIIQNYLLVRHLELEFSTGLTVLTGETGAGKSMILGALDVLLGARFPKDAIGKDAERAVIEGIFRISPRHAHKLGPNGEKGSLSVRREISRGGRSRSWINDSVAAQDELQRLREFLADFHGQREQQTLFNPHRQLEYLDAYAGCTELARSVQSLFMERLAKKQELSLAQSVFEAFRRDQALLEYQLEEIERLGLKAGEEEAIEGRLRRLENAEKLAEESARILNILSESDSSLSAQAGTAKNLIAALAKTDSMLKPVSDELAEISSRIKDIAGQVRDYHESLELDEAELARLRERRGILWELRRKHGLTVEQILTRAEDMKSRLAEGEKQAQIVSHLQQEIESLSAELVKTAKELSRERQRGTKVFSEDVLTSLRPLGFSSPEFQISIETLPEPFDPDQISAEGADRIEFLFSANPGLPPSPIQNVASGGESSRVTLAIKSVLSEKADYPLMVYDEIDIGISGRVADQVGKALEKLARRHQLMVITHLPQIASRAAHHLEIEKQVQGGNTVTTAHFLSGDERVKAVASLLAGAKVTDRSLASASELLRHAGKS